MCHEQVFYNEFIRQMALAVTSVGFIHKNSGSNLDGDTDRLFLVRFFVVALRHSRKIPE
jgi:hypothetical protein